jgi:hypothetical protein
VKEKAMRIQGREGKLVGWAVVVVLALALGLPRSAAAHCDTLDGPVVVDAKKALEKKEITPVLKWVGKNEEAEVRAAFKQTLAVRQKGGEAKELADQYFFETLVRLHRLGEGAPYTGLKPAGTDMDPAVKGADLALETGAADKLLKMLTDEVAAGLRERFGAVLEKKKHAKDSVEAGRQYVAAYVDFVHYVERLHVDAQGPRHHHETKGGAAAKGSNHH